MPLWCVVANLIRKIDEVLMFINTLGGGGGLLRVCVVAFVDNKEGSY